MSDNPNGAASAEQPVCAEATPQPPPPPVQQQLDEGARPSPARQHHQNGGSPAAAMAVVAPSPDTPRKRGTDRLAGEL